MFYNFMLPGDRLGLTQQASCYYVGCVSQERHAQIACTTCTSSTPTFSLLAILCILYISRSSSRQRACVHLGVALDGVEHCRSVDVEDTLKLKDCMINGRLEVAVLRVDHQPYICLHAVRKPSSQSCKERLRYQVETTHWQAPAAGIYVKRTLQTWLQHQAVACCSLPIAWSSSRHLQSIQSIKAPHRSSSLCESVQAAHHVVEVAQLALRQSR